VKTRESHGGISNPTTVSLPDRDMDRRIPCTVTKIHEMTEAQHYAETVTFNTSQSEPDTTIENLVFAKLTHSKVADLVIAFMVRISYLKICSCIYVLYVTKYSTRRYRYLSAIATFILLIHTI